MTNQVMMYCKVCEDSTVHVQPSTSHLLHLILSLITLGLWIFIWILVALNNITQAQCTACGVQKGIFGSTSGGIRKTPTPDTHKRCPDCRELILMDAKKCKHCGCLVK